MQDTLVIDSAGRPIGTVNWQRAVKLYFEDLVDVIKEDESGKVIRSQYFEMPIPRVIRIRDYVAKQTVKERISPNKHNIAIRDNFACQYCGANLDEDEDQTLDHVIPVCKGGKDAWDNLVLCCRECNTFKGSKDLSEVGYTLSKIPTKPEVSEFRLTKIRPEWEDWLAVTWMR